MALLARLVYLLQSAHGPAFHTPVMDAADYDDLARSLLDGHTPRTSLFWQSVFYPLFLAGVYRVTGASILAAKLLQAFVGAATCALTCRLGQRLFGGRIGLVAGLVTALYGPLIFFEGELLATGWAALWAVALVLLFLRAEEEGGIVTVGALGACGALAVMTRPTFLPPFAAAGLWFLFKRWRGGRRGSRLAAQGASLVAGFLLVAGPVALLNQRMHHHFGFLPASGGINFYIGNNPEADATTALRPGAEWSALLDMPARAGVQGDIWQRERFFYRRALDYARDDPASFLHGLAGKSLQLVSSRELPRSVAPLLFNRWSSLLAVLQGRIGPFGWPFGLLLPLALLGAIRFRRAFPGSFWLMLAGYAAGIVMVFVASRYRTPLVPLLAVPAAAGAAALASDVRRRRGAALLRAAPLLLAAVLVATLPGPFPAERANYATELFLFVGNHALQQGDASRAIESYRAALVHDPQNAAVHAKLGEALANEGKIDQAIAHFRSSLAAKPGSALAHAQLGVLLQKKGDLEGAVAEYLGAIALQPDFARAYANLGGALRKLGREEDAIEAYRTAAGYEPKNATILRELGVTLAEHGDGEEAVQALAQAARLAPDDVETHYQLAVVLRRLNRLDEAEGELERALALDPHHEPSRTLLGAIRSSG